MKKRLIFYVIGNMLFDDFRRRRRRKIFFLAPQAPKIGFWGWFSSDFLKENAPESAGKSFAFERIFRILDFPEADFPGFCCFSDGVRVYLEDFNGFQSILDWAKPGQGSFSFAFY